MNKVMLAAVVASLLSVSNAYADLVLLPTGSGSLQSFITPVPAPGVNPNSVIPGLWGYLNGNLYVTGAAGDYEVTFTFVGAESGYSNALVTSGGTLQEPFGNTSAPHTFSLNPNSVSFTVSHGGAAPTLVDFLFRTYQNNQDNVPDFADLENGANAGVTGNDPSRSFFVSFCDVGFPLVYPAAGNGCNVANSATSGNIAWLALDDSGDSNNDNHDDWVGYVSVRAVPQVPEPASVLLLGVGLLGTRYATRRRR